MQETWVQSLGWEDPLGKEMATHSSILACRIPWTEEPGRLHSMGLQRIRHNWVTNTFTFQCWLQEQRLKFQPCTDLHTGQLEHRMFPFLGVNRWASWHLYFRVSSCKVPGAWALVPNRDKKKKVSKYTWHGAPVVIPFIFIYSFPEFSP